MIKQYLNTFLAVCESGSFTKAAARTFITPSAVTQQINSLEKDLGVSLFERTPKGVKLTNAGEYLSVYGAELVRRNEQLRRGLADLASEEREICVATSMMEKCRLLYDLWILFSQQGNNYQIRMASIDSEHHIPERTDLIESVNGHVPWTKSWEFMEICKVPFGFAFQQSHPLYGEKWIRLEQLRGETVMSINDGSSEEIRSMLEELQRNDIHVVYPKGNGSSLIWECAFRGYVLVAPVCWDDILINMSMSACEWEQSMAYGFFYRKDPAPAARNFLEFIRKTYAGEVPGGRVPVLTEW